MRQQAKAGAVLYAKNLARVSAFYAQVCGLRTSPVENDHVVLESPAFQLVVLAIPEAIAATIAIATPPIRRENTPIKLVFFVDSIDAARECAVSLGGALNPSEREWRFEGGRVCDGYDPEGNVLQLREHTA